MKWKLLTIILVAIFAVNVAGACKNVYYTNENVTIIHSVLPNSTGIVCNISIFNSNSTVLYNSSMYKNGSLYSYNGSSLPIGLYTAGILCNTTTVYSGECLFQVKGDDDMLNALAILIFVSLSMFCAILYFLNTIRAKLEQMNTIQDNAEQLGRLRNEFTFRLLFVLILTILNMVAIGFIYYIANSLGTSYSRLSMIFFIFSFIIFIIVGIIVAYNMLLTPYKLIVEGLSKYAKQKGNNRR